MSEHAHRDVSTSSRRSSEAHDRGPGPTPGKQTLTGDAHDATVQRAIAPRGASGIDDAQVHAAADRGTSGPGGPLPHLGTIQRLFGPHDVSQVQAHTDGAAREGSTAMGAEGFARGHHVAFAGSPSLHTAAHEAAHVVQQRGGVSLKGGVGEEGDVHERHADAVADRVVRGESAAELLGQYAAPSGSASSGAVQRAPKREREAPEAEAAGPAGGVSPELGEWLAGDKRDRSYADNARVHSIDKGDHRDLACWNWALRGLQDAGGPSPGEFWEHVLDPTDGKDVPPSIAAIPAVIRAELTGLTERLADAGLARAPADLTRRYRRAEQQAAAPIMQEMCNALVAANGFTVVAPDAAAATVVCQYIATEGAAVPEHWWIELPGGVVIQTVNGRPLEVGGEDTKWHSAGGRDQGSAARYREVRVPVRALKGEHVAILEAAMANAAAGTGRRVRARGR